VTVEQGRQASIKVLHLSRQVLRRGVERKPGPQASVKKYTNSQRLKLRNLQYKGKPTSSNLLTDCGKSRSQLAAMYRESSGRMTLAQTLGAFIAQATLWAELNRRVEEATT
jgi:hypothetical protein